ncbi:hypothetical protein ABZ646_02285 [Streptomyces sp. NPDC007162]|uniref:hypothetical protein n=1 Tax=Streptomyces sp. NPDC007162 TaxID=3156917 RepID=UPI00340FC276
MSNLGDAELFRTCARLGPRDGGGDEDVVAPATFMALRMLAERIEQLTGQIDELPQSVCRQDRGRVFQAGGDRGQHRHCAAFFPGERGSR